MKGRLSARQRAKGRRARYSLCDEARSEGSCRAHRRERRTLAQINLVGSQEMLVGYAPLVPLILIGMLLTAAGVYGVLAFAITRRSKEFAVRIAVGASVADLVRLVASRARG